MKRVYWRPHKMPKAAVFAVGLTAVLATLIVERTTSCAPSDPQLRQRMAQASRMAKASFDAIRDQRRARGHEFPKRLDPGQTGMIGMAMSPMTSLPANLADKQTSVNPNFAAVVVDLLRPLDLQPGDLVAVGCTGSFPALNICVLAALESLGCDAIVIHSVASSQFGANHPDMTWLDMETLLHHRKLISTRSSVATLGGFGDRAVGMSEESRRIMRSAIDRNEVEMLKFNTLAQSIDVRMKHYARLAAARPMKAYVNVGGGAASIHGAQGKNFYDSPLSWPDAEVMNETDGDIDCVMARFAARGTPVVHVGNVAKLAGQYGLPLAPRHAVEVDTTVAARSLPNRYAAAAVLVAVLLALRACVRTDALVRVKQWIRSQISGSGTPPEQPDPAVAPACQLMV